MSNKRSYLSVPAFAKINLTLCVTGKRADGFHTLKSVMQSVSLCDTVTVIKKENGIFAGCSDKSIPCDGKNTAYKAAEVFFRETGICGGAEIHIEKRIPTEAGLGGGSADAAAVLKALDKLYGTKLPEERLFALGALVGADVPFCIMGGTVLCEGTGEVLTPLLPMPLCFIVIGKGKAGVSTKEAYERIDLIKDLSAYDFPLSAFNGTIADIAAVCSNEFEAVTDIPEITRIKDIMYKSGALTAHMTGSGSAVYGIFSDNGAAEDCAESLKTEGFFSECCIPMKGWTLGIE